MTENLALYDVFLVRCMGDSDVTAKQLVTLFGIAPEQAMALLRQLPTRVKHKVSHEVAIGIESALVDIGAEVVIKKTAGYLELDKPVNIPAALHPPLGTGSSAAADMIPRRGQDRFSLRSVAIVCAMLATFGLVWKLLAPGMVVLDVHRVAQGKAKPALVLLHGYGAPGDDLVGLAKEAVEKVPGIQIVVPEAPHRAGRGFAWWTNDRQEAIDSRVSVIKLVDELVEEGTAPNEIVIAGFSQGAILAVDVGLHYRHDLAGIGMLSGRKQADLGWDLQLAKHTPMQVFVSHGKSDRRVRFNNAKSFVSELKNNGHKVIFVQFDSGHKITTAVRKAFFDFTAKVLDLRRSGP
ncbi:MAG: hypothetical protein GY847_23085 [Proteobacteria bacterium]|nr:hypothetical protein [Pseudomonadota bacterium]